MSANWNVKTLTSRDRVRSITISRVLGEPTKCTFQMEEITVNADDSLKSSIGLADLSINLEEAATNPTLAPFVQQISDGLTGLSQALYITVNPGAVISE